MSSLREAILGCQDIPKETVEVPEWGVTVEVRGMDGAAKAHYLERSIRDDGSFDWVAMYPELCIACCHDPATGEKVFDKADREAINAKSASALERVGSVAMRLSGMGDQAVKEAKGES